jgi:hypothetical protein
LPSTFTTNLQGVALTAAVYLQGWALEPAVYLHALALDAPTYLQVATPGREHPPTASCVLLADASGEHVHPLAHIEAYVHAETGLGTVAVVALLQSTQAVVLPSVASKDPKVHAWHPAEPSPDDCPRAHTSHVVGVLAYCPAAHAAQLAAPTAAAIVPGVQSLQAAVGLGE